MKSLFLGAMALLSISAVAAAQQPANPPAAELEMCIADVEGGPFYLTPNRQGAPSEENLPIPTKPVPDCKPDLIILAKQVADSEGGLATQSGAARAFSEHDLTRRDLPGI